MGVAAATPPAEDGERQKEMSPSPGQSRVRAAFKSAALCFAKQPDTDGAEPPSVGYRGRDWWYDQSQSSGLFYYDYFMQQTIPIFLDNLIPDWCKDIPVGGIGGNALAYAGGNDYSLEDDIEMPVGHTFDEWPNESGKSRCYFTFDVNAWSTSQLDNATALLCIVNILAEWPSKPTVFFHEWRENVVFPPATFSEVNVSGTVLYSALPGSDITEHTFNVLPYVSWLKSQGIATGYITVGSDAENAPDPDVNVSILGPHHPDYPVLFSLF